MDIRFFNNKKSVTFVQRLSRCVPFFINLFEIYTYIYGQVYNNWIRNGECSLLNIYPVFKNRNSLGGCEGETVFTC